MNRNIKKFKEKIAPYHRCDFVDTVNDYLDEMGKELREIIAWEGIPLTEEFGKQIIGQKKLAKEILGEECE